jgi:3-deoxy-7-phosphoheptulonate synthase
MANDTSPSAFVIVLEPTATQQAREELGSLVNHLHATACTASGDGWTAISVGDGSRPVDVEEVRASPAVQRVVGVSAPYRLASRELFDDRRPVRLRRVLPGSGGEISLGIGGPEPVAFVVAPASADGAPQSPEGLVRAARRAGGAVVHAGELSAEPEGEGPAVSRDRLMRLRDLSDQLGLLISVEVSDVRYIDDACTLADMLQVTHGNMQNFSLLRQLGATDRPILLRRGLGATVEEFLLAAEYVLANGNGKVMLCESGIGGQGSAWKPRFEINVIPLLKQATHLPVLADPSHASLHSHLTPAVAKAAIAAGADGLVLEVAGEGAWDDAEAPIDASRVWDLHAELQPVAAVAGRRVDAALATEAAPQPSVIEQSEDRVEGRTQSRPRHPIDVLRRTEGTLESVIESILGTAPRLDVIHQQRISPPYPSFLEWLLRPEGDLLVRWTQYRMGPVTLTRNLSYVDFGRVDPTILARLEAEEIHLGQLFRSQKIDKFGFEFGTGVSAGEIDLLLRQGHTDEKSLHPYVWRRYIAATSGRVGFLVIESLPTLTWRRLLASEEERARLRGAA